MTRTTLTEALAYECGLTKKESKTIVDTVFKLLTDALIRGEDVTITDFASFRIKDRPSRVYRNSVSGELMEIRLGKRVKVKMSDRIMKAIDPSFDSDNVEVEYSPLLLLFNIHRQPHISHLSEKLRPHHDAPFVPVVFYNSRSRGNWM